MSTGARTGEHLREIVNDWSDLDREFREIAKRQISAYLPASAPHFEEAIAFAAGRVDEGQRVAGFLEQKLPGRSLRVLDVGAGNGGVSIGVANVSRNDVTAVDILLNTAFLESRRHTRSRARQLVANGHALPFANSAFDVVLCLETVEHVPHPEIMGSEIMRVLRPGGICMIMTPARVKHLLRRDPHYGVRALLLLPDALQRFVVTRVLRRAPAAAYDVIHTFWTLNGLGSLFPGHSSIEPLFNDPSPPGTLWYRFRNYFWDRVLITK